MKDNALIVVAKEPRPGDTKTRLCPPLSSEMAAELYRCMLLDTLALVRRVAAVDLTVAYAPDSARPSFLKMVDGRIRLTPQRGGNLGERLANALAEHFALGYQRVIIMNSDGPTLPVDYLEEAVTALEESDIALGMGHDGGYYLIGMKKLHPALFEDIEWSTSKVISATLDICRRLGLQVHRLPEWYDVDVALDLARLWEELSANPEAAPRTWCLLQMLDRSWGTAP